MGFAGQVFAARVAIGLAVPSPKALSKTGSMLAMGVKQIHKRIQLAAKESDLTGEYQKKLAKLNQGTRNAATRTSNLITTKLEQNLDKMSKKAIKNTRDTFKKGSAEYNKFQKELNKPFRKRKDVEFATSQGMMNMHQMAKRMSRLNKQERMEQLRHQAGIVQGAQRILDKQKKEHLLLREKKKLTVKELEAQLRLEKKLEKNVRNEKERLRTLRMIDKELEAINREMDEMDETAGLSGANIVEVGNQLRTNFNDALRNTVAIMAGFGFQSTRAVSALVEFERELINANSVFNLTHDELFSVGNEIIKFGNQYGITVQNGAEGLYQLASAGVDVNEALAILPETLKLSMAVQGDHNTISKLTAQTLFGFGMEMDQAAEVTDKFAFAIQKSLIEYQDLASAVKFALPFFTSTGQSIDQLLGALQILTNRALEAGIAGRGLRQAVAEFAESAMDAEVGFRKMGVEILNAQGEMLQLDEIARRFAAAVGPETASNTELLTTLIQDLNVRGATAFIHLVQASDEFTQAVEDTKNAGGQLDAMIEEQNKSLSAQIQILKTNILSIYAFRDAAYEGTEYINAFHEAVVTSLEGFKDLIIEGEGAEQQLTKTGMAIQRFTIDAIEVFVEMGQNMIDLIQKIAEANIDWKGTLQLLALPLQMLVDFLEVIPKGMLEMYIKFKLLNSIIPITTAMTYGLGNAFKFAAAYQLLMGGAGMLPGAGPLTKAGKPDMRFAANKTRAAGIGRMGTLLRGGALLGAGMGLAVPALAIGGAYLAYKHATKDRATGGYVTPMASGGYPQRNTPYLVGEHGPELFMPNSSGQILNTGQTDNIMDKPIVLKNVTIGIDSFGGLQ